MKEFVGQLDDIIGSTPQDNLIVIDVDLKGHIREDRTGFVVIMGIHGYGDKNEGGEVLPAQTLSDSIHNF